MAKEKDADCKSQLAELQAVYDVVNSQLAAAKDRIRELETAAAKTTDPETAAGVELLYRLVLRARPPLSRFSVGQDIANALPKLRQTVDAVCGSGHSDRVERGIV
jgi:hypothetical protein